MKNFLLPAGGAGKQNQKYQLENPVQFGRRAKRGNPQIVDFSLLAPQVGFEPTTNSLTGSCATIAPLRNDIQKYIIKFLNLQGNTSSKADRIRQFGLLILQYV